MKLILFNRMLNHIISFIRAKFWSILFLHTDHIDLSLNF